MGNPIKIIIRLNEDTDLDGILIQRVFRFKDGTVSYLTLGMERWPRTSSMNWRLKVITRSDGNLISLDEFSITSLL